MTDRIKAALDAIHAEEELKQRTQEYLARALYGKRRRLTLLRQLRPALAAACLLLVLCLGGSYLYFTPTAFLSVDINPSLELGINRFDRVVSVEAYNEDGQALSDTLEIKYLDYRDALEQIVNSPEMSAYLEDGILSLTVAGEREYQCEAIYQAMEDCASGQRNIRCHTGSSDAVQGAHSHGMSVGRYQVYLILRELDPDITVEEIQNMTMGEMYQKIWAYAQEQDTVGSTQGNADGYGYRGHGHGHGYHHGAE